MAQLNGILPLVSDGNEEVTDITGHRATSHHEISMLTAVASNIFSPVAAVWLEISTL